MRGYAGLVWLDGAAHDPDEMAQAHSKAVRLALSKVNWFPADFAVWNHWKRGERGRNRTFNLL